MRKIILNLAITLDGFIEGPNGELDWLVRDPSVDFGDILNEILSDKDAIFYGRKSYEKWGRFTPGEGSPKMKTAYELLHTKIKYVFSRSVTGDGTNAIFINDNIKEKVQQLKQQRGKNIWLYGGASIVTTFLNLDLVDEFRLAVHPVIIGKGKPLFQNIEHRHRLNLISTVGYKSGVTLVTYETKRD
ncbi:MAG TPA: dihydrofolate reductase family protein [Chitinophagaceae bacterium]|jgi:dihydrofolate reductase|nr:dihydrofolate reductase family protein [Chitinophagaceae bacterium]